MNIPTYVIDWVSEANMTRSAFLNLGMVYEYPTMTFQRLIRFEYR